MRLEQRFDRFGKPRHVLRYVDERNGEVTRAVQNGEA